MQESLEAIEEHKQLCEQYEQTINDTKKLLDEIENKITSIPVDVIDIESARNKLKSKRNEVYTLTKKNKELQKSNTDNEALSAKLASFLQQYDVEKLHAEKQKVDNKTGEYEELVALLKIKNKDVDNYKKKVKLLETHEYDPDCKYCSDNKFVKEAHTAKDALPNMLAEAVELRQQTVTLLNVLFNANNFVLIHLQF